MNMPTTLLTPIALFVYRRLEHTQKTIEALQKNLLASESELYIFSDGAKGEEDAEAVEAVRVYLRDVGGFKSVHIFERERNAGLALNIIEGVSEIVERFGRIIVLEDDLITSPYFLSYMNRALDFYEKYSQIWHIAGWNHPVSASGLDDTFAWRSMQCWGWGTWRDRWNHFKKDPKRLIATFSKEDIHRFDLDGIDIYWNQVLANNNGKMNSWAVFWYATIFERNGVCISPSQSYIENIGFDGSGVHTGYREGFSISLNQNENPHLTIDFAENETALNRIKLFYRERENQNMVFSKNLNRVYAFLEQLRKKREACILYGAGTGAHLVAAFIPEVITYIVDTDPEKEGKRILNIPVYGIQHLENESDIKIIITPFGRSKEITEFLSQNYSIPIERLVSLDIFD